MSGLLASRVLSMVLETRLYNPLGRFLEMDLEAKIQPRCGTGPSYRITLLLC